MSEVASARLTDATFTTSLRRHSNSPRTARKGAMHGQLQAAIDWELLHSPGSAVESTSDDN